MPNPSKKCKLPELEDYNQRGLTEQNALPQKRARKQPRKFDTFVMNGNKRKKRETRVIALSVKPGAHDASETPINDIYGNDINWALIAKDLLSEPSVIDSNVSDSDDSDGDDSDDDVSDGDDSDGDDSDDDDDDNANKIRNRVEFNWLEFMNFIKEDTSNPCAKALMIEFATAFAKAKQDADADADADAEFESLRRVQQLFY